MPDGTSLYRGLFVLFAGAAAVAGCAPRFPFTDWPIEPVDSEHEIGTSGGEFQEYPGVPPYFHQGIDILDEPAANGPWVRSVTDGVALGSFPGAGSLYNAVLIVYDNEVVYKYGHLDYITIPQAVVDAAVNMTLLPQGTELGQLVNWTSCNFHHLHYEIFDLAGKVDPIITLSPRVDTTDPVLHNIYFVENTTSTRMPSVPGTTTPLLSGDIDVIVHAHDTQFGTSTTGVMQLSYWVNDASGNQAKAPTTVRFSTIPDDNVVEIIYRNQFPFDSSSDYCATEYYYYVLTNVDGDGNIISDAGGFWDTTTLPNGTYEVYAEVEDPFGNDYTWSRPVEIAN